MKFPTPLFLYHYFHNIPRLEISYIIPVTLCARDKTTTSKRLDGKNEK